MVIFTNFFNVFWVSHKLNISFENFGYFQKIMQMAALITAILGKSNLCKFGGKYLPQNRFFNKEVYIAY